MVSESPTAVCRSSCVESPFHFLCLADGQMHVVGLREPDDGTVPRGDGDFGLVAVLFHGEDHLGFEFVSENLADFGEAGFDFAADGGCDFVLSARVLHVH